MANILVLGAGELGEPILRHLISGCKPGTCVSLVEAKQVTRIGMDINRGTVEDLAALFQDYDTVVSASGMVAPSGTQLKLAHAVLRAGVSRYVPWQFGLDYDAIGKGGAQDLFDEQLDVRALLRGQKRTEWVIISTGIFMTFLFVHAFGVVEGVGSSVKPKVRALGSWENKVTYTHPEDIGRVTAIIVQEAWQEVRSGVAFVAGDTVSFAEVADKVSFAAGVKVDKELWDITSLVNDLKANPNDGMRKYRVVLAESTGVAWEKDISWNAIRSIHMKTVGELAEEVCQSI